MLVSGVGSIRVAVLGSGISGSTAATFLAQAGHQVTVFEMGRGVGGRTSTRRTREGYVFDHGAQYISAPKTAAFSAALDSWKAQGVVRAWDGRFASANDGTLVPEPPEQRKERWVGYPSMNSIAKELLKHEKISVVLGKHVRATSVGDDQGGAPSASTPPPPPVGVAGAKWIVSEVAGVEEGPEAAAFLGEFDWLVCSDRLAAMEARPDLATARVPEYREAVNRGVANVPCLVLMVAFGAPLDLPADGILFPDGVSGFGSLGWAARDTSKPGRHEQLPTPGHECWVVQSSPAAAAALIERVGALEGGDFARTKRRVAEEAAPMLLADFRRFVEAAAALPGGGEAALPEPVLVVGHRWSAAFPDPTALQEEPQQTHEPNERKQERTSRGCDAGRGAAGCGLVDPSIGFVACGDYLELPGRVEGAFLSGKAAAEAILLSKG